MQTDSQSLIIGILFASLLMMLLVSFVFILFNHYFEKKRVMLLQYQQLNKALELEFVHKKMKIEEQAYNKVSQDIHDNLGQMLSVAKLQLSVLIDRKDFSLGEKLKELLADCINELRNLVGFFNIQKIMQAGLIPTLQGHLDRLVQTGHYQIQFHASIPNFQPTQIHYEVIIRFVQEVIHNIIKHAAEANTIELSIFESQGEVNVFVASNGVFLQSDPSINVNPDMGTGIGQYGLHQKAHLIQGNYIVETTPNGGRIDKLIFKCP